MRFSLAVGCLAILTIGAISSPAQKSAQQQPAGPINFIIRVEVDPAWMKEAIAALGVYRAAALKKTGAVRLDLYQEISQPNRFLIEEVWKDYAAYEMHAKSSQLADRLKAGLLAPPDARPFKDWLGTKSRMAAASEIHVFTHLDVHPPNFAALEPILQSYMQKNSGDTGAARFEALQGLLTLAEAEAGKIPSRKNHMTLAEAWASEADFRAHQCSAHTIEFRAKLDPLLGALYDQRLYRRLK